MNKKQISFSLIFIILFIQNLVLGEQINSFISKDPNCLNFNSDGSCFTCYCRFYLNKQNQCISINDLCRTWNINTGQCTSCYIGYQLINGTCITFNQPFYPENHPQKPVINQNCLTISDQFGTCSQCRQYYILRCGDCQMTGQNPNCTTFDISGQCTKCDDGFILDFNNICQQILNEQNSTLNCSKFQNCKQCNQYQCTLCEQEYRQQYLSKQCVKPTTNCSQQCALCSQNQCFSCAEGYSSQGFPPCQSCSFMYTRDSKNQCKPIQRDCSKFDFCIYCVINECLQCKQGYSLKQDFQGCQL